MPLYEYKCKKCKKEFELMRKMSDKPLKKCIHCTGTVEKLISRSAFHLKGGGWFDSGYSGKNDAPAACGDSSSSGASCASGTGASGTSGCPKAS